jgi:hypothetical protein
LCFVYTSWCFYAFSGTNPLTRCHSASSLFSAIFVFQKSYTGNILGIGRNEARTSYFSRTRDEVQRRAGGGQGSATPYGGALPLAAPGVVWAPWPPSDTAPPPIKSLRREKPKSIDISPSKVPQRRRCQRPISGDRSLCSGTLPGWGSAPGAISIDSIASTAISIDVAVSHDKEGVVLPRG